MTRKREWAPEEEAIIKTLWPRYRRGEISLDDILKVFQNRSINSVRFKAYTLGLGGVVEPQVNHDYLKKLQRQLRIKEI